MSQAYSDPRRESDPHALPDVEVWYGAICPGCGAFELDHASDCLPSERGPVGQRVEWGWYWQACFPGCLPDSDPMGPFATEAEALADAREGVSGD